MERQISVVEKIAGWVHGKGFSPDRKFQPALKNRAGIFSLSKWAEIAPSWAHLIRINIFPGLEANLGMQRSDFAYLESKLLKIKEKTFEWNEGDRI